MEHLQVQYTDVDGRLGPVDARIHPRFAGPPTFARLPRIDEVGDWDVGVLGVPFDAGTSYRPGARFGPAAVRAGSRLLRAYHPHLDVRPFAEQQVVDVGDLGCNPFDIEEAIATVGRAADQLLETGGRIITIGGDHTIALPLLRSHTRHHGPVALLHFDAHLDTWDTYFGAPYTHGTPFRRASEEGLFLREHSMHVGIRAPLYGPEDLEDDARMGFRTVGTWEIEELGTGGIAEAIRDRIGDAPVYVSIDIDVLDPAFAPGTGTPEIGGFSSRELAGILRQLRGLHIVGADVVEVAPAYDHAEITALAAANVVYELLALTATSAVDTPDVPAARVGGRA